MKPKRSVLFIAFAGEEKGLLGSLHYTDHPIIPLSRTVTDLNIDMIGRVDPDYEKLGNPNYTYVIGSDKLSKELHEMNERANQSTVNLTLDYKYNDPNDPNRFYSRSDHYNFAKNNVPIIFYFTGTHADYHRPTDDVDKINFERMLKVVKLVYTTGWMIANADHRPIVDK
jgi:Zn-dependent M28 family amino/carboxypeptidase